MWGAALFGAVDPGTFSVLGLYGMAAHSRPRKENRSAGLASLGLGVIRSTTWVPGSPEGLWGPTCGTPPTGTWLTQGSATASLLLPPLPGGIF